MSSEKQSVQYVPYSGNIFAASNAEPRAINDAYFDNQWKLFTAANLLGAAGVGAGATGLYRLLRHVSAENPKTKHQNFYAGPKTNAPEKQQAVEEKTAETNAGPSVFSDYDPLRTALWGGVGNMAGIPLAGLAGHYAMKKLLNSRKKQKYEEQIAAARQEYERALSGKTAALAEVYDAHREKISADTWSNYLSEIPGWPVVNQALRTYGTYAGGAGTLSAALAGKLVFDLTRQKSQAAALRRAQEARARISALPPLWVTPDDVVTAKQQSPQVEDEQRKAASK